MALLEILNVINATPTICNSSELSDLLTAQSKLARWVSSHEVHVLFGGLRHPVHTRSFLFPICSMDFASWQDFAADSTLFPAILKAVWLRCIQGGTPYFATGASDEDNRKALTYEITKELTDQGDHLDSFKDFYVSTHYNPVRSAKSIELLSLEQMFLFGRLLGRSRRSRGRRITRCLSIYCQRSVTTAT